MLRKKETIAEVLRRSNGYDNDFYRKARIAFNKASPSAEEHDQYDWLVGAAQNACHRKCSNADMIRAARRVLLEWMEALWARGERPYFYFGTIIHSPWETTAESPHLDLKDMHDRTRNVVRSCGFDGALMKLEIQAVPGRNGTLGTLLPHAHFVAISDRHIRPIKTARRVSCSNRLQVSNSAAPLHIWEIHSLSDLRRAAAYLLKSPYSGKSENPNTRRYERTIQGMRSAHCLRLVELLSHIDFSEVWFGTGSLCPARRVVLDCLGREDDGVPYPTGRKRRAKVGNLWDSTWQHSKFTLDPISIRRRLESSSSGKM